jgi:hypothetical protein
MARQIDASPVAAIQRQQQMKLVQSAMAKHQARQELTKQEATAWARWEGEEDERRGRRYLAAMPKKAYCDFSGRQVKILHDQADLYGIPLRGATVHVSELLAWVHDFLAKYKHQLAPLVKGGTSDGGEPGLEEQLLREQVDLYRKKNVMLEEKIQQEQERTLPREEVHTLHAHLAKILRGAGEQLHKQFGENAAAILNVALMDFESALEQRATPKSGDSSSL